MNGNGPDEDDEQMADMAEIVVTGPLDLAGVREVGVVIDRILTRCPARLVIDVSACPHVDAAGIGLLLDTHRRLWRTGGRLTLRSPSPRICRLLRVARVDQVFHMVHGPSATTPPTTGPAPVGSVPAGPAPAGSVPAGSVPAGSVPAASGGRFTAVARPVPPAPVARGRAVVVPDRVW